MQYNFLFWLGKISYIYNPYKWGDYLVIFDIDGFLIDVDERKKRILSGNRNEDINWKDFFKNIKKDKPISAGVLIAKAFIEYLPQIDIMFLTGRTETVRKETLEWLSEQLKLNKSNIDLTMRPPDNFDADYLFKEQVGAELGFRNIDLAFDDTKEIIDMWERHKVPCCRFFYGGEKSG